MNAMNTMNTREHWQNGVTIFAGEVSYKKSKKRKHEAKTFVTANITRSHPAKM
jgi:hypothetical protein